MEDEDKRVTPAQLGAFGVGLFVTIVSTLLTTPIAPFNILISLALGSAAGYGTLKVLDPRSRQDVFEAQTNAEYQQMLQDIAKIAVRTGDASQSLLPISPEMSERLGNIAKMIEMILDRYRERPRDYTGVSAALIINQKFDEVLAHYLRVKQGKLFMDEEMREKVVAESETHGIPMFETALENFGKKLDAGETLDKGISKGTLESMLRSLNLIESLSDQMAYTSKKGDLQ
jgi:hypothetical protein